MTATTMREILRGRGLPHHSPPAAVGAYATVRLVGEYGAVSGQFPFRDGALVYTGRVGMELSESQGRAAAELSAANVLLQLEAALGDLGRLRGLLRVDGYVASADAWTAQPKVLDAASELFTAVLGDRGRHARSAVHVPRLPLNAAVKLVTTFIAAPGTDR